MGERRYARIAPTRIHSEGLGEAVEQGTGANCTQYGPPPVPGSTRDLNRKSVAPDQVRGANDAD